MPLTDREVASFKPADKPKKYADGEGLFIMVATTGTKLWRWSYRFDNKQKTLCIGAYPEIGLKEARTQRDAAKQLLKSGVDPSAYKQEKKRTVQKATVEIRNTFESIAREWYVKFQGKWSERYAALTLARMEQYLIKNIGAKPITSITPPDLLAVLQAIEEQGKLETAHRVLQISAKIYRYAIATGRATLDIAAPLQGAIPPAQTKHYPTITNPRKVGELLRAIDGYEGKIQVRCALQLSPLLFVRPSELRCAVWEEFNLDDAEWRIPAERMKMRDPHIVPLATQAIGILKTLHEATGNGTYLFPSIRSRLRPMSDNTVNAALRLLGYGQDEITGHGFRSMASTLLNEQGWNRDAIERQLAHAERNQSRAAYNFAELLPERRKMMQGWADYLDSLRNRTTGN